MTTRFPRTLRRAPEAPKPFLYPRGTTLAEIPPHAKGLTEMEYLDYCIAEWKKAGPPPEIADPSHVPAFGRRRK